MLIKEILQEGIDTTEMRQEFAQTLSDNKEKLQKVKTTLGMTIALKKLFPGVKFKFLKSENERGQYLIDKDLVVIYNVDGFLSPKNVRNNWEEFSKELVSIMTHENIHKEQFARGARKHHQNLKVRQNSVQLFDQAQKFSNTMQELRDTYNEAMERKHFDIARKVQKRIDKLIAQARRSGVELRGTFKNYLSDPLEITAFAEEIASTIVDEYGNREEALNALKSGKYGSAYSATFDRDDKVLKRLYKQVARYIEQKTS